MKKTILTLTASLFAVLAPAQNLISSGSPLYKLPYKNTYVMQTLVAENTFRTAPSSRHAKCCPRPIGRDTRRR